MGNSLKDELLKAGLVTEEQARGSRTGRGGARKKRGGKGRRRARGDGARPAPAAKAAKKPAPDPAAAEDERIKALNLQIRKLIDDHRVNDAAAEHVFHFTRGERVKHVYVTEAQRAALARGELAITGFRARHHLVPAAIADRIQSLRPEVFVYRTEPDAEPPADGVPDDLVW